LARQRLGQHFLTDPSILKRVAEAACAKDEPLVVEIGPGKGALTDHLVRRARRVVAVELDSELAARLGERLPQVEVVRGDALAVDLLQWGPAAICGNLPYYAATPIISRSLRMERPAVFMVQKEVAERITAEPGGREYGYFSVECQFFATAEYLFSVPPGAFRPPPQVDSAVVRLTPRDAHEEVDTDGFLAFVSLCFRQKRKTLRNNLAPRYPAIENRPEAALRAEQLTLAQFAALYRHCAG
jgi:16S rRNA (adenine1518-N6/adenine1519-N6)-dimethyltransferase